MGGRQLQVVEAFLWVRAFVDEHPARETLSNASARNELELLTSGRTTQVGAHQAARSLQAVQLVRGRWAVERVDAIVRASYRRDPVVLVARLSAKREQKTPVGPCLAPIYTGLSKSARRTERTDEPIGAR